MPQIEINNLDDTVNFSQVSEEERKEFARKIMSEQIGFVRRCLVCFDCAKIIVNLIKIIIFAKVLTKLLGVMTGREVIDAIVEELEEDIYKITYN